MKTVTCVCVKRRHLRMAEAYPAATETLDRSRGLLVDFPNGLPRPSTPSWNNAMQDELLIFAGDEILSVAEIGTDEVSGGYQVKVIRGRYDTRPQTHAANTELYFIERKRLKRMTHASFKRLARCNLKLQPTVLRKAYDLGLVQNLGLTFSDRVHQPPGPLNLRAFQEGRNATYTEDEDIDLAWSLAETGPRDFWGRWQNPAALQTKTVLEFFTLAGTLKRTVTTQPGATSYTYKFNYDAGEPSRPYIENDFGPTPPSIKVRATALENGLKSRFNEELTIRKI